MAETAGQAGSSERDWWLRALLVLQSPRPVFAALRDDSQEAVVERQEPVLAIVLLGGLAGVLMTSLTGSSISRPASPGAWAPTAARVTSSPTPPSRSC